MSLGKTSRDGSINGTTHHNHDEMVSGATGGEIVNATHEYALTFYVSNRWQHKRYVSGWPGCKFRVQTFRFRFVGGYSIIT